MALSFKLSSYTTEELKYMTGVDGELVINSDNNTLVVMDGKTPGGIEFDSDDRPRANMQYGANNRWLFVKNGTIVDVNGHPVREMGMNVMEMLCNTAQEIHSQGDWAYHELPIMYTHGIKYIRANSVPYFWADDFQAFIDNKERYWKNLGAVLDLCHNNGVGVLFNLMMNWQAIPDWVGGHVSEWADSNSLVYQTLIDEVVTPMITKYGNHPAISGWDLGNELNMKVEFKNTPKVDLGKGTLDSYTYPLDGMTKEQMMTYYTNVFNDIQALDPIPGRMITTGNNGRITSIGNDTTYWWEYFKEINEPTPTITWHTYRSFTGNIDWTSTFQDCVMYRKLGAEVNKPAVLQEIGPSYPTAFSTGWDVGSTLEQTKTICDGIYRSGLQLTYWWIWRNRPDTETVASWDMHSLNENKELLAVIERYNSKMRAEGHVPVENVELPQISDRVNVPATVSSDGTGRIEIDASTLDRTDGFSYSFWLKTNENMTDAAPDTYRSTVFCRSDATHNFGSDATAGAMFDVYRGEDANVRMYPDGTGNQWVTGFHGGPWSTQWMHIVVQTHIGTQNDGELPLTNGLTVFLNGKRCQTVLVHADREAWVWPNTPLVLFDHSTRNQPLTASLADFKIYNRALTDIEITSMFLHGRTPPGTLQAHWTFEGGSLTDIIGGLTATASGGITFGNDWTPPPIPY